MIAIEANGRTYEFCRSVNCGYKDKFNRMVKLAAIFDTLSDKLDRIAERGNYSTEHARLAVACKMMMYTGIRIGNEGSAEGYMTKPHPYSKKEPEFVRTYGLTTLLPEHIMVKGKSVVVNFVGKKQVENTFTVKGELAKQIKAVRDRSDTETLFDITDYTLTKFIKTHVGRNFMPKDFRTMRANMYAYEKFEEICDRELPTTKRQYRSEVREVLDYVSDKLNNTPGVCKASYIDDMLWDELESRRLN